MIRAFTPHQLASSTAWIGNSGAGGLPPGAIPSMSSEAPEPPWVVTESHCGEIIQIPWVLPDGRKVTVLITLPDNRLWSAVRLTPTHKAGVECRSDLDKLKRAIELTLKLFGEEGLGLKVDVRSNIPTGVGMGTSTSQCIAGVRATSKLLDCRLTDIEILRLVFLAEGPCDPLTAVDWGATLIWASREGLAVEVIAAPLPQLAALGFVTDPAGVDTRALAARTNYIDQDIKDAAPVLEQARRAILEGSAVDLAAAATMSASLNQKRCPTPWWPELMKLREETGAAGLSVSHSGTAAALLWPRGTLLLEQKMEEAQERLLELGALCVHEFATGGLCLT